MYKSGASDGTSWCRTTGFSIRDDCDGNNRCAELDEITDNDNPSGLEERFEPDFKADGEENEHDPDLAESLGQRFVRDEGKTIGACDHTND